MPRAITRNSDYQAKLVKLIPTEFIAAYLAIDNVVPEGTERRNILTFASAFLLLVLPFYLAKLSKVTSRAQIVVTCGSYVIWIYSLGGPFNDWDVFSKPVASVLLILWTTLLPLINFQTEE